LKGRRSTGAGAADGLEVSAIALGVIAGADFFTTEVWTWRGLVTFYTVFVIDLASRRVQIVGSTPHPNQLFMDKSSHATAADDGFLRNHGVLIASKWSISVCERLREAGFASCTAVQARMRMPMRSGSYGRSKKSVSTD